MRKKIYDAAMLIIAISMLILGYMTYQATVAEQDDTHISMNPHCGINML